MKDDVDIVLFLERLGRMLKNDTHADGLKPSQWDALRYLARANRFSRTPSALTAYFGMTKGTVSQTLKALERKGLIAKTHDPLDRRNIRLSLTKAGSALLKRDPASAIRKIAGSMAKDQQAELVAGLNALLQLTLEDRGSKSFGVCKTCRYFEEKTASRASQRCKLLDVSLSVQDSELICVENITL